MYVLVSDSLQYGVWIRLEGEMLICNRELRKSGYSDISFIKIEVE